MKRFRILFFIFIFLTLGIKCNAQSQYSAVLTKMENSIFGIDYNSQSDDSRLKRLEESVYGTTSNNSVQQRVDKLSKDLSADLIGQEIKPKKDTFAEDDGSYKEPVEKADSSVKYPVVDNLEKSVFNKEFKTMDINQRVANLEQKVFSKTYNDDLSSRVDRLKQAVMPERIVQTPDNSDDYTGSYNGLGNETSQFQDNSYDDNQGMSTGYGAQIPQYNSNNSVLDQYQSNSDITIPLAQLERVVLKKSYPNDTVSNRLLRMELKIFNSTFTDDDEQTRIDRIASAYQAKKTSKKYDSNKFAQHAATAMQIGAILLMILAVVL